MLNVHLILTGKMLGGRCALRFFINTLINSVQPSQRECNIPMQPLT